MMFLLLVMGCIIVFSNAVYATKINQLVKKVNELQWDQEDFEEHITAVVNNISDHVDWKDDDINE